MQGLISGTDHSY